MGFVSHESCPNCGSRNNLARYDDESAWCFGCHYWERGTRAPTSNRRTARSTVSSDVPENPPKPEDCGTSFSETAVEWLAKFHLDIPTAIKRDVVYSPSREQIIYQMGNVWQARNLKEGGSMGNSGRPRSKNFTSGNVNECTHIYGSSSVVGDDDGPSLGSDSLVIVEDPVSAIRIASLRDSMPLLGSHLATTRLNAVAGLYRSLVLWLDSDKLRESREMARRAQLLGLDTRVIWTDQDPKCYTKLQLQEILNVT